MDEIIQEEFHLGNAYAGSRAIVALNFLE